MNKKLLIGLVVVGVLVTAVLQFMYRAPAHDANKASAAAVKAPAPGTVAAPTAGTNVAAPVISAPAIDDYTTNIPTGMSNESLIQLFSDAISKNNADGSAYYQRALIHIRMQHDSEAMDDLNMALRLKPNSVSSLSNRAVLHIRANDLNKAIDDYNSAITISPNDPKLLIARGTLYSQKDDLVAALADLDKAVSINPNYDKGYFTRGEVYEKQKRYPEAKADYDKAIKNNKTEDDDDDKSAASRLLNFYYRRAIINLDLYDLPSAMADVNYVLQFTQTEAKVYKLRSAINTQMGNVTDAASDTAIANKLEAANPPK